MIGFEMEQATVTHDDKVQIPLRQLSKS